MSGDLARFTPERCIGASIDHISGGRWGINVVTGYAPSEARMFGGEPVEHDRRYEMAGEFTDILTRLWGETKDLTPRGKFWSLEKAFITPKPRYGRPVLVNATGSPAGINHAGGAFRPRLHNQPGRPRDRRGACRSPRAHAVIRVAGADAAGSCAPARHHRPIWRNALLHDRALSDVLLGYPDSRNSARRDRCPL
jgi:alkanesulfonate monooxygenase SsuD/methylene tetrahydromethanopterin reductase-like flavin-dependent oxidoreductase (luciferase family)